MMTQEHRTAFVAILGHPNVGKSTLLNRLLGTKVSIVSPKPQTTQRRLRGIVNVAGGQLVLVDTPGLCGTQSLLHRAMRRTTQSCAQDADLNLLVCDATAAQPIDAELA
ncbi:MAG: GTP-binding protein, partial [Acetobacteraceae bacterium]